MNNGAERDHVLMSVVAGALQQPPDQRKSFLQAACRDDAQLYKEAAETVEWEERMGNFLLEPLLVFKNLERPFHPGDVVSERFEIIREIGEGGMGVVYEAYDRKRKQRIAIKSAKCGFRRLLTPELESALQVRHPNICLVNEIHTAATPQGEVDFLTMEFLDGAPLSTALSSGVRFSHSEALEIARQLCSGLAEAHRSGVIHRDLKGSNVIICRLADGRLRAVITDFGLAASGPSPGETGGTPRYMAPELWQGGPSSKASDIYALGVILHELVTGQQFDPLFDIAASGHPAPPTKLNKDLDRRWDSVILPCLATSPAARPPEADAILRPFQKKALRKSLLVALAVLAALLVVALMPAVRNRVLEQFRPAPLRVAILSPTSPENVKAIGDAVVARIRNLRLTDTKIAAIPSTDVRRLEHATHLLQVNSRREGDEVRVSASLIDLSNQRLLRDFSARYSSETVADIPAALAGLVSAGLHLHIAAPVDSISPAAKTAYDQGQSFLRRDSYGYEKALSLFQDAARADPHSPLPLAGLAEAQVRKFYGSKEQNYLEEARQSLSKAEALNPDAIALHLADGYLNQATGQYATALEDYQRVLEIDPRNVIALLRNCAIYDTQNLIDTAIDNCQKASSVDPGNFLPQYQLGSLYFYHGRYQLAVEQFQKAVEIDPQSAATYANLGAALDSLGKHAEGEQALLQSLKIRENARALNSMGVIRENQGRDAEAADFYRRAVAMEPHDQVDWLGLGDAERRLGHLSEARQAFHKVKDLATAELQQNPHRGHLRAFVAYAESRLGQQAEAEVEINEALHSSTSNSQVIRFAVLIYEASGKRDKALEVLKSATPESLQEISHIRDLASFQHDPRFIQLLATGK